MDEKIKQKWCWFIGRWKIQYGEFKDCYTVTMDVEIIQDGFIIGMSNELKYRAIPVTSILYMEKE